jgi:hypothetical protein
MHLSGACLCGSITYEIYHDPSDVADYCHCKACQRSGGAPVLAWVQTPQKNFRITRGTPKPYASSAAATRWFCPDCGSPLYMSDAKNISIGITLGTLDQPEFIPPTVHGWSCERIPWFNTTDELPKYDRAPPYDLK